MKNYPPYMGVSEKKKKTSFAYFSTSNDTYPQIKHSYPQTRCLNKDIGKLQSPIYGHYLVPKGDAFCSRGAAEGPMWI